MGIKYFVTAAVSEYKDDAGATKSRYSTIGIITETAKGDLMLKLESLPILALQKGALWAFLNAPEDKKNEKPADNKPTYGSLDDIPF
jgi:hypothetical protein